MEKSYLISILLLLTISSYVTGCPSDCSCKWKGGKQFVECVNRSLRTFPGPIDATTQVLDLGGNSFETLPSDHFMRMSLINLQKIFLARCRISSINSRAFRGLSNLVDLDLSNNALREVPSSIFPDCQGLMRLVLSGNPITHIFPKAFVGLTAVTNLEISHCHTEVIEKGSFDGLESLEWLKLDGNRLMRLDGLDILPQSLKGLWLEENPWDCDCRLIHLRIWTAETKVGNTAEPRCATPSRLTNTTLKDIPLSDFACPPQLSPTTMYQKIGEGKNVSLLCKVTSTPESSLEWWFNNQPINNFSLNILVETTTSTSGSTRLYPTPTEKKSELLVLNATAEENGTFLCIAKNPGGVAIANFTLRVLSPVDLESYTESGSLVVGTYTNLFLIIVSSVAVIGLVLIIFLASLLLCRCSRLCGGSGLSRDSRIVILDSRTKSTSESEKDMSERKDVRNSGSGGNISSTNSKIERHLSDASTLTTHTKSNGSVFLLSTSSELGDSNPDLIEGAKRLEADGHDTYCSHLSNNGSPYPTNQHFSLIHPSSNGNTSLHTTHLEPTTTVFPMDYGLSKGLNVTALLRRSPAYTLNSPANPTIPITYDLAKYPKEYINPMPLPTHTHYLYTTDEFHHPQGLTYVRGPAYAIYGPEWNHVSYVESRPPTASCSCGPIMEETEEGDIVLRKTPEVSTSKGETLKAKARLQRQLTTTINESPDEGYEDESAEGAEV